MKRDETARVDAERLLVTAGVSNFIRVLPFGSVQLNADGTLAFVEAVVTVRMGVPAENQSPTGTP